MDPLVIMALQATLSMAILSLLAARYLVPRLRGAPRESALVPLLAVNAFRYLPLILFAPGQVDAAMPMAARSIIAYGDLASGLLAFVALVLCMFRLRLAAIAAWVFLVVGLVDSAVGGYTAMTAQLHLYPLGFSWMVVAFYVPMILVSQAVVGYVLLARSH